MTLSEFVATAKQHSGDFVRIMTDDARAVQQALEAAGLTFRSLQVIERPKGSQRAQRSQIHAAMDPGEMIASYMKARPVPVGVDPEKAFDMLKRLWEDESS